MFRDRSTGEILVLFIGATICLAILIGIISVVVIEIANPENDSTSAGAFIGDVLNTLVGLMAGYLAGRTSSKGGS